MTTISQFPPTEFIPFNTFEQSIVLPFGFLNLVSFVVDAIITYALAKDYENISVDSEIILIYCVADGIFSVMELTMAIYDFSHGGFSLGKIGCIANAHIILLAAAASVMSVTMLTLNRYLIIIHHYYLSKLQTRLIIGSFFATLVALAVVFEVIGFSEYGVALMTLRLYCFLTFWSMEPLAILSTAILTFLLFGSISFLFFAYYSIITFYMNAKKKQLINQQNISSLSGKSIKLPLSDNEIKLIKKCLAITCGYLACWFPYLLMVAVEFITQRPPTLWLDTTAAFFVCCGPAINGAVMILYDAKVKRNVYELLGIPLAIGSKKDSSSKLNEKPAGLNPNKTLRLNAMKLSMLSPERQDLDTVKIDPK